MNGYQSKRHLDQIAIYTFGHVERLIEDLARSNQVPAHELTERVAALLQLQTNGALLGTPNRVPALPGARTGGNQPVEQMEVARRAYRRTQNLETVGHRGGRPAKVNRTGPFKGRVPYMRGYKYNGRHWMQDPKNRKKVMALVAKAHAGATRRAKERRREQR